MQPENRLLAPADKYELVASVGKLGLSRSLEMDVTMLMLKILAEDQDPRPLLKALGQFHQANALKIVKEEEEQAAMLQVAEARKILAQAKEARKAANEPVIEAVDYLHRLLCGSVIEGYGLDHLMEQPFWEDEIVEAVEVVEEAENDFDLSESGPSPRDSRY